MVQTLPEGYDIRYTEESDRKWLKEWLLSPQVLHWFPMSEGTELEIAINGWIGFSRYEASLTALVHGEPCSIGTLYLMPYKKVAHECLIKLIVAPKWKHQGIGTSMMKNLMHLAKNKFGIELAYIEIVEGNPLEQIARNLGFAFMVRQENFFKDKEAYYARLLYDVDLMTNPHIQ